MQDRSLFTTEWIIENSVKIMQEYPDGMTVRQLHYRLVSIGMTNDDKHYHKVCVATKKARWEDILSMNDFIDRERTMYGETKATEKKLDEQVDTAKLQVGLWMENYNLDRWSNQNNYIEVWIEKKALQGVFETPCDRYNVGLGACKGYPSLTFLNEARQRFDEHKYTKDNYILYFGDYDPSGEDIPRSIQDNLLKMDCDVEVIRLALTPQQIEELQLVGVPPKAKDTRTNGWDGKSVVELDAVDPKILQEMCEKSIQDYFDNSIYQELKETEKKEKVVFQEKLKDFVNSLSTKDGK